MLDMSEVLTAVFLSCLHPFSKTLCLVKDQKSMFFSENHREEVVLISAFTLAGLGRFKPYLRRVKILQGLLACFPSWLTNKIFLN